MGHDLRSALQIAASREPGEMIADDALDLDLVVHDQAKDTSLSHDVRMLIMLRQEQNTNRSLRTSISLD